MIFSLKNIKQGHELDLTYLYACWIMQMRYMYLWQISIWSAKGGQKSLKDVCLKLSNFYRCEMMN